MIWKIHIRWIFFYMFLSQRLRVFHYNQWINCKKHILWTFIKAVINWQLTAIVPSGGWETSCYSYLKTQVSKEVHLRTVKSNAVHRGNGSSKQFAKFLRLLAGPQTPKKTPPKPCTTSPEGLICLANNSWSFVRLMYWCSLSWPVSHKKSWASGFSDHSLKNRLSDVLLATVFCIFGSKGVSCTELLASLLWAQYF